VGKNDGVIVGRGLGSPVFEGAVEGTGVGFGDSEGCIDGFMEEDGNSLGLKVVVGNWLGE